MVARGDLGVEIGAAEVPLLQKRIILARARARKAGDHRDADARVDDPLAGADAGRGVRRRERDPRRHLGDHALRRDGRRRPPGRGGAGDGPDRAAPSSRASATATRSRLPTTSRRSTRRCRTPPATSPRRSPRRRSSCRRSRAARPRPSPDCARSGRSSRSPTSASRCGIMALEWGVTPLSIPETTDVEDLWRAVDRRGARRRRRRVGRPRRDHGGHRGEHPRLDERDQGRHGVDKGPASARRSPSRAGEGTGRRTTQDEVAPAGPAPATPPHSALAAPARRPRGGRVPLRQADRLVPRDAQPARRASRGGRDAACRARPARRTARAGDECRRPRPPGTADRVRPPRRAPLHRRGHSPAWRLQRHSRRHAHSRGWPRGLRLVGLPCRRGTSAWTIGTSSPLSSAASRGRSGVSSSAARSVVRR